MYCDREHNFQYSFNDPKNQKKAKPMYECLYVEKIMKFGTFCWTTHMWTVLLKKISNPKAPYENFQWIK